MGKIFMVLAVLVVLGGLAILGYAVFFDLPAPVQEITIPVANGEQ